MHARFDGPNIMVRKKKEKLEYLFANFHETCLTVPITNIECSSKEAHE